MSQVQGIIIFGAIILGLNMASKIVRGWAVRNAVAVQDAYEQNIYDQWQELTQKFGHRGLNTQQLY